MRRPKKNKNSSKKAKRSELRIVGGSMRGRKVHFIAAEGLRPTLDHVRETLFNWLAANIHDTHCLDLFAGSGALAFEAISRGAKAVTLVESNTQAAELLKENCRTLSVNNVTILNDNAEQFLTKNKQKFDLVFLDPPFGKAMLDSILINIRPHLSEQALLYVEQETASSNIDFDDCWQVLKSKKTSRFCYSLIRACE